MNCHEDNKEKQGTHNHNLLKHMLHMVLCCGLPIVIVAFLPIIARLSPGAGNIIAKIVPYLCPIMMIPMIFMMFSGSKKGSCCDNKNENEDNNEPLGLNKPID